MIPISELTVREQSFQPALCNAFLITGATVSMVIPRDEQSSDLIQTVSSFVPLLALHEMQHWAMFSAVTMRASFFIYPQQASSASAKCSQALTFSECAF
ncbi:MAG: hypothetical protein ACK5BP_04880 [Planctomyces sp.]|jgi:hypothetical protein